MPTTRLLVIGAGFAGTNLVRRLDGRLPAGCDLTLLSDESYTTFNPMLPEAVGATVFPEQVVVPVREMIRRGSRCRFVMGSVMAIDLAHRVLVCRTLAGERRFPFDHLVLACGNRARLDLLPGMAAHALPLKTVGDAMHIRNMVLRRLAHIELETEPDLRRALGHFIVIGGSFSGTEVAGELVDCLHSIRRYYPRVAAEELRVTVLHTGDRLLPELPPGLGASALRSLQARGVDVRLLAKAIDCRADGVALEGGDFIHGHTLIGTIGTSTNPLAQRLGLASVGGRITVGPDMAVPGQPGLWALGDCAAVPNALDGNPCPPTAQFAIREARHLADNLLAVLAGRPTRPFSHRSRGMMAAIGHLKGVADVGGVQLSGWPAWLVWRAYYLSQMPSLGRRLRIFLEWSWGMFFPPDITHLRFTRSAELLGDEVRRARESVRSAPAAASETATPLR